MGSLVVKAGQGARRPWHLVECRAWREGTKAPAGMVAEWGDVVSKVFMASLAATTSWRSPGPCPTPARFSNDTVLLVSGNGSRSC
jgi:hypothetical protein